MPEIHLRWPLDLQQTNRLRVQKFKERGDSQYIYENELDEACFQHDMAYRDIKDFTKRTASDEILHHKAFNIAKNPKYDEYQLGLASMVCKYFDKRTAGEIVKNEIMSNKNWQKNYAN